QAEVVLGGRGGGRETVSAAHDQNAGAGAVRNARARGYVRGRRVAARGAGGRGRGREWRRALSHRPGHAAAPADRADRRGVALYEGAAAERYVAVRSNVTVVTRGGRVVGSEVRVVAVRDCALQSHLALREERSLEGEAIKHLGGDRGHERPQAEKGQEDPREATRAGDLDPLAHRSPCRES